MQPHKVAHERPGTKRSFAEPQASASTRGLLLRTLLWLDYLVRLLDHEIASVFLPRAGDLYLGTGGPWRRGKRRPPRGNNVQACAITR